MIELLERDPDLDLLRAVPDGHVVLVHGEAGIGKTALLQAFTDEARAAGRTVLWGSADALSAPRPLGPLRDIARAAAGRLAAVMAADSQRDAMFDAFLDELAARDLVVVVEDVHWADQPTLDLLLFTTRRISTTRSLLLITYRDDEIPADHPLTALLGALARAQHVTRIPLAPLSLEAVRYLAVPLGVEAARLHAQTGGNPFFVTEALAEPQQGLPATVRDAVLARAVALGSDRRTTLDEVAIFPSGAPISLLGPDPTAVDACVGAGMLVTDGRHVRFRHELARLAILESIPPGRRISLHAKALAGLAPRGTEPALLAFHAEEAGDAEAVLRYAPVAAARAETVGASQQMAVHWGQAVRFSSGVDVAQRAEFLEQYAAATHRVDRNGDALAASDEAIGCWRTLGDTAREAILLARRGSYLWSCGDSVGAHESARAALELAERLPPGPPLTAALAASAQMHMLAREIPEAIDHGWKAIELAERLDDGHTLARALNAVGSAYWFQDPDQAQELLERSVEVARRTGDDASVSTALVNLGSGAGEIRRYAAAERWLAETRAWCAARELGAIHGYATAWLARCLVERCEWEKAAAVLDLAAPTQVRPAQIVALTALGRMRGRRGEPGAADALQRAWDLSVLTGDLQRLWPVAAARAEIAWATGRPTDELVRGTYELALELGQGWPIGELGAWLEPIPAVSENAAEPYRLPPAEAAVAWDALGCPYDAALALARSDDRDHLLDALARFERIGAQPAAQRVAKLLRDMGVRPPRRSTLAHPDGLTAREVDVLDLLREGLRNAEIAERLHISVKTVDHHVSSILTKLDVPTRRDAVRRVSGQAGTSPPR